MRIKVLLMAVVLTGLLFSLSASAQTGCPDPETTEPACFNVPMTIASGQSYRGEIPKFDSSLGTLISARLTVRACAASTFEVDSEDPLEQTWHVVSQGNIVVTPPVGPELSVNAGTPDEGIEQITGPDDEPGLFDADFAGPDYFKLTTGTVDDPVCEDDDKVYDLPVDLAVFNGIAGEMLDVQMRLRANKDSGNENGSTYEERAAVLASGEVCVEYTYQPPCPRFCINGTKIDACTQEGIPGWTITLYDDAGAVLDTKVTDSTGAYSFCYYAPGDYRVCEETRAGLKPIGPTCYDVTLVDANEDVPAFANTHLFCIRGYKYKYNDNSGLKDWTITLKDSSGTVIGTKMTDATGKYSFCGLVPGDYEVCETVKDGWTPIGDTCRTVSLECKDSTGNNFINRPPQKEVCETAWAFLDDWKCFAKTGNWGSLTEIAPGESLVLTGDMVAGRAKCDLNKGTEVGTATITVSANGYVIDFDLNDDCHVEDLHVWVNNAKPVVKGGFSDKRWYKSESRNNLKLDLTKPIWVAVHTSTCCSACNYKEACTYSAPK